MIQLPDLNTTATGPWTSYTIPMQTYVADSATWTYNPVLTNVSSGYIDTTTYIRNIVEEVLSSSRIKELDELKGKIAYLEYLAEDLQRKIEALTETVLFDKQS